MKIDSFKIRNYGPLRKRDKYTLSKFNLFYGDNESGKTLTIDALIKILLGTYSNQFQDIDRINEMPNAYININEADKNIKIEDPKEFQSLLKIFPQEFANLFIIRDSNLIFHKDKEFYNNITDILLGLRMNDIEKLIEISREIGHLTSTGKFTNAGDIKMATRLKDSRKLIKFIDTTKKELEIQGFNDLEKKYIKKNESLEEIQIILNNYYNARKREKYNTVYNSFDKIKKNQEFIKSLDNFNEIEYLEWLRMENDLDINLVRKIQLTNKLESRENQYIKLENQKEKQQSEIEKPLKINSFLNETVKSSIHKYKDISESLAGRKEKQKFFNILLFISAFLLGIFFALGFIILDVSVFIIAYFFLILFVVCIFFRSHYI